MNASQLDYIAEALDEALRAVDGRTLAARRVARLLAWWDAWITDSNNADVERSPEECVEAWQDFRSMAYREVTA